MAHDLKSIAARRTTGPGSARAWSRGVVGAIDRRLIPCWTRTQPPPVDQALVKLSEAADHSSLWLALATAAAALGGRRGKRAAEYAVLALAFTSATINGPVKLLFNRHRPPRRRLLRRTPRTSSFPSGHSASAFAFAVAATRELPEAGPVLLALAGSVAYARAYLGAHYPSDVIAGALFGTAAGVAARPTATRSSQTRPSVQHPSVVRRGRAGRESSRRQQPGA